MKEYKYFLLLFGLFVVFCINSANAENQEVNSIATTEHIKEIVYHPNGIHKYTGFFGYQSSIVFEEGESIGTISMGNSTGWQLNPQGNRLFLKPIEDNPETNVTILTNKRVYHFVFYGKEAKGLDDPELAYEVRFRYPNKSITNSGIINNQSNQKTSIDISTKPYLNFNYRLSGADEIKPLKVFDDGQFTYLQFMDINAELPAIFLVDSEGYEALINYHISGPYIVIERVAARFTLRHGSDHVCLFNENMKYKKKKVKKVGLFR
jgi:type IV secretion system protein VirB9